MNDISKFKVDNQVQVPCTMYVAHIIRTSAYFVVNQSSRSFVLVQLQLLIMQDVIYDSDDDDDIIRATTLRLVLQQSWLIRILTQAMTTTMATTLLSTNLCGARQ